MNELNNTKLELSSKLENLLVMANLLYDNHCFSITKDEEENNLFLIFDNQRFIAKVTTIGIWHDIYLSWRVDFKKLKHFNCDKTLRTEEVIEIFQYILVGGKAWVES